MLGPRDPDEYLLPTERRVIRVRRHWISLTRVLLETVGILIIAFGLSYALTHAGDGLWLLQTILW
ncbi:MAG: PH domain-containing protein, partial [Actinobacteria bacterium]|nr:PH domain-containing protein [Actinomycetota bacterium]